jgi:hypothetical protein
VATLQDRLVSELRLHQIATLEVANAFLPGFVARFNERFARPAQTAAVWRRAPEDLDLLLGCRYTRVVGRDHTVGIGSRRIQIPRDRTRSWAGYRVVVRELLNGDLVVLYHDLPLAWQSFPGPPATTERACRSKSGGGAAKRSKNSVASAVRP